MFALCAVFAGCAGVTLVTLRAGCTGVALVTLRAGCTGVTLVTLRALLARHFAQVLGLPVVVGDYQLALAIDLCLDDVLSLRLHVDDHIDEIGASVGVGDLHLPLLVISNSVGVLRSDPFELGALRQLVSILDGGLCRGELVAFGNRHCVSRYGFLRVSDLGLKLLPESDLHRVVVRGTERVAVAVQRIRTVAKEVLRIVLTS